MTSRPRIAPVLIPHGFCLPGCPWCPADREKLPVEMVPDPVEVSLAIDRVWDKQVERGSERRPVELAFYGGDLWQLPRGPRTDLLDAAEWEVRRGRASSIRLTLAPRSILRAPLAEFQARGVRAVEVPIHSLDRGVLKTLGARQAPRLGLEAIGRLNRARLRSIVHVSPGLPGSSHVSALASVEAIAKARPDAARVLPALVLQGTLLESIHGRMDWEPMSLAEATSTCRHLLCALRSEDVEVIRVGLQPEVDLQEGPLVMAGPYHPGLRLLVEAETMRLRAVDELTSAFALGTRAFTFVVNPREESYLRGNQNENLRQLKEQFRLERVVVVADEEQPPGELRVLAGELTQIPPLPSRRRAKKAS